VADALHGLAGLGLCLLMAARVRMLRAGATSRSLWVALAVLGLVQVLQVDAVYRGAEHALGHPGSAALLTHGLTVLAAAATLSLHNSLDPDRAAGRGRRHLLWAGAALAMMLSAFALSPPSAVPAALARRSEYYDATVPSAVTWAAYLSYLSWSLAGMFGATRRFATQAPAGPLRTGLRLGAAGIGVGFGYVVLKVVVVGTWLAGLGPSIVRFDAVSEAVVLSCCLLLIGTGSAYEAISARITAVRRRATRRRSLRRLQPLAQILQLSPAGGYSLPVDGDQQRLICQVTDIRDAQRSLRGFIDPTVLRRAEAVARAAGVAGDQAGVLAEAAALELARRAKARGERPRPSVLQPPAGGRDLDEEVRCLERLAAAYHHPFVWAYVDCDDNVAQPLAS